MYYFPNALFVHCYVCDAATDNVIVTHGNPIRCTHSECGRCGERKRIYAIVPLDEL